MLVYVGTYTDKGSKGIYAYRLDGRTGRMTPLGLAAETPNPTFLAVHPNHRFLYAVNEVADYEGKMSGSVSAYQIDRATGRLKLIDSAATVGTGPCHVTVDRTGKCVLVANYNSGSAAVLPIRADGGVGAATCFVQHEGASVDKSRQEGPHAHCATLDAANKYAFVADLGLDKVMIYKFDAAAGKLSPNTQPFVKVADGAGPRHIAFHPNGRFAYVIAELDETVTVMDFDAATGSLKPIQTISTLPEGFAGKSYCAEVMVHPNGRFLYGSNRGHDSLAIFAIDQKTGRLTAAGHQSTLGKFPRNFNITPAGDLLLAANQDSDSIYVFRVDQATGRLTPTGEKAEVSKPVCITFVPLDK
jgi:6-phosphogluconolactonase